MTFRRRMPALVALALAVRAFPFRTGSLDAALLVQPPAGAYPAVVESGQGIEGVILVGLYLVR